MDIVKFGEVLMQLKNHINGLFGLIQNNMGGVRE
jgi:hypothetical protein